MSKSRVRSNILLFLIGIILDFVGSIIAGGGVVGNVPTLTLFSLLSIAGAILQIIAIVSLRNENKNYANAMWSLILYVLVLLSMTIVSIVSSNNPGSKALVNVSLVLDAVSDVVKAFIAIYFVLGTNQVCGELASDMPRLTRTIVILILVTTIIGVVFNILGLFDGIKVNEPATIAFGIIALVFDALASILHFIFLLKAQARLK